MKMILIIGATSAIAEACERLFAKEGHHLFLVGRSEERLTALAKDLKVRGAEAVDIHIMDANDFEKHQDLLNTAIETMGGLDIVLIAHGSYPDQKSLEKDYASTLAVLNTNLLSAISLLTYIANYFEKERKGSIAVIGSVAGDRGRKANYVYGTGKGGLEIFLGGLRNRLHDANVHVLTIEPGFVDTPMTAAFDKGLLWTTPEKVASDIVNAIHKKKDTLYTPHFWRLIMFILCAIPERIFKRLSI